MITKTKAIPQIEKQAMAILVEHPETVISLPVEEKWFSTNQFRILTSFINLWNGQYHNEDQVKAAFNQTEYADKFNVEKLFAIIHTANESLDYKATFENLRHEHYKRAIQASAQNVFENPSDFNFDHLMDLHQADLEPETHSRDDTIQAQTELLKEIDHPMDNFMQTYPSIDKLLGGGIMPSQFIVIGARPSVGKSSFALNLAYNAILKQPDLTVEIFSLEMGTKEILRRLYAAVSGIPLNSWQNPAVRMNDTQKALARDTVKNIGSLNFIINDRLNEIGDISHSIQHDANRYGARHYLAIVDHLQLVEPSNQHLDPRHSLEEVSRQLKLLTQTLNIPILALSQLSRAVEKRDDKEPNLSDLRETGAIEQDANIVAFLWRDDDGSTVLHFAIKKNRNGPLGKRDFYFDKAIQKISEVTYPS